MNYKLTKKFFKIPKNLIYLNGNSLGPLPKNTKKFINNFLDNEWGKELVRGWNKNNWFIYSKVLGNKISKLIGAPKDTVVVGDTLSIQVFQALSASLDINKKRKIILSDKGNFPTDIYMAQGLINLKDRGYKLKLINSDEIEKNINEKVAVLLITEVDYRSAKLHDIKKLTKLCHKFGVLIICDLAHSTGAIPINVIQTKVDFAIGCTYKYLNGGPGSPAFIYVAKKHINKIKPSLYGWHGHKSPFEFNLKYEPSPGIDRMRIGTPSILSFKSLESSLKVFEDIDMKLLKKDADILSDLMISEIEKKCPDLKLLSPKLSSARGSHIAFIFEKGYELVQDLIAEGVICDFRSPNIIRFGITPLYLGKSDIIKSVKIICNILSKKVWTKDKFIKRALVT